MKEFIVYGKITGTHHISSKGYVFAETIDEVKKQVENYGSYGWEYTIKEVSNSTYGGYSVPMFS